MNQDLMTINNILENILDIVGFKGDKKQWVENFKNNCQADALVEVLKALPEEKQTELKKLNVEDLKTTLPGLISKEELLTATEASAQAALIAYLNQVIPNLSEDVLSKLKKYLSEQNI